MRDEQQSAQHPHAPVRAADKDPDVHLPSGIAELRIELPIAEQLAASRELLEFVRVRLNRGTGRELLETDRLRLAIASRAASTYEALITLCERGFSEQAGMLVRPLFEALVDAHWVRTHPGHAVERLTTHRDHVAEIFAIEHERTRDLSDAEVATTRTVVGPDSPLFKAAKGHWTGTRSLSQRIKAVGDEFPRMLPGPDLDDFELEWNRWANWLLHGSSMAFDAVLRSEGSGPSSTDQGLDDYRAGALFASAWIATQLGWLAMNQFPASSVAAVSADLEEWVGAYAGVLRSVQGLTLGQLITVDGSEPCPCDSGRRAAHCHLTPAVKRHREAAAQTAVRLEAHLQKLPVGQPIDVELLRWLTAEYMTHFHEREKLARTENRSSNGSIPG